MHPILMVWGTPTLASFLGLVMAFDVIIIILSHASSVLGNRTWSDICEMSLAILPGPEGEDVVLYGAMPRSGWWFIFELARFSIVSGVIGLLGLVIVRKTHFDRPLQAVTWPRLTLGILLGAFVSDATVRMLLHFLEYPWIGVCIAASVQVGFLGTGSIMSTVAILKVPSAKGKGYTWDIARHSLLGLWTLFFFWTPWTVLWWVHTIHMARMQVTEGPLPLAMLETGVPLSIAFAGGTLLVPPLLLAPRLFICAPFVIGFYFYGVADAYLLYPIVQGNLPSRSICITSIVMGSVAMATDLLAIGINTGQLYANADSRTPSEFPPKSKTPNFGSSVVYDLLIPQTE